MKESLQYMIQKYSEGSLTLKEQIELAELLADKKNSMTEQILLDDWKLKLESEIIFNRNLKPLLDKIHHRIHLNEVSKVKQINWIQTFQRVAAILFLPLLLSFLFSVIRQHSMPVKQFH